jgi:hypothetical protein
MRFNTQCRSGVHAAIAAANIAAWTPLLQEWKGK